MAIHNKQGTPYLLQPLPTLGGGLTNVNSAQGLALGREPAASAAATRVQQRLVERASRCHSGVPPATGEGTELSALSWWLSLWLFWYWDFESHALPGVRTHDTEEMDEGRARKLSLLADASFENKSFGFLGVDTD